MGFFTKFFVAVVEDRVESIFGGVKSLAPPSGAIGFAQDPANKIKAIHNKLLKSVLCVNAKIKMYCQMF